MTHDFVYFFKSDLLGDVNYDIINHTVYSIIITTYLLLAPIYL